MSSIIRSLYKFEWKYPSEAKKKKKKIDLSNIKELNKKLAQDSDESIDDEKIRQAKYF